MDMIENRSEEMSESEEATEECEFSLADCSCSCSSCGTSDANPADFEGALLPPCESNGEVLCTEGFPKLTDMVWQSSNIALRPFTVVRRLYPQFNEREEIRLPAIQPYVQNNIRLPWANLY